MESTPKNGAVVVLPSGLDERIFACPIIEGPDGRADFAKVWVFSVGDQRFSAADVVDAAWFRGDLGGLWREILRGAAAEGRAGKEGSEPKSEILQDLSEIFRSERDLITAEETENWLEARGLTLGDFNDFIHREYWRRRGTPACSPADLDYADVALRDRRHFIKEVLFSGRFESLARRLSWAVVARLAAEPPARVSPNCLEAEREGFFQRTESRPDQLSSYLRWAGRDLSWFEGMVEVEAGYRCYCHQIVTPENRARTMAALRLPLTSFRVEMMDLESDEAAREAVLCLESDGLSMEGLARQEGCLVERQRFLLEEFPEGLQRRILGAEAGRAFRLAASDNRFQVCRVVRKTPPCLEDDKVLKRVDEELLSSHFGNLEAKHVHWLVGREIVCEP
jgi:hypothetical protein